MNNINKIMILMVVLFSIQDVFALDFYDPQYNQSNNNSTYSDSFANPNGLTVHYKPRKSTNYNSYGTIKICANGIGADLMGSNRKTFYLFRSPSDYYCNADGTTGWECWNAPDIQSKVLASFTILPDGINDNLIVPDNGCVTTQAGMMNFGSINAASYQGSTLFNVGNEPTITAQIVSGF